MRSAVPLPVRSLGVLFLTMTAAAGPLTQPYAAASPEKATTDWSCAQTDWRNCLEELVDPDPPAPEAPINFSVRATKPDDFIRQAFLHYRYQSPYGPWNPPISYFDIPAANGSTGQNREAYAVLPGYLGGTILEFWWDVYDRNNERLHTDPPSRREVAGNHTWPPECPVPGGFEDCVDLRFGYLSNGLPAYVGDGAAVPSVETVFVEVRSHETAISQATVSYGLYRRSGECRSALGEVVYGPSFGGMMIETPGRRNASVELSTSEPGLDLLFNVSVTDDYGRALLSRTYRLCTVEKDPCGRSGAILSAAAPECPVWVGQFIIAVRWTGAKSEESRPAAGAVVSLRNSSGEVRVTLTDAEGLAYSPLVVTRRALTWEVTVTYRGEVIQQRVVVPDRERERTGNYTFVVEFRSPAARYDTQESADQNYFVWTAAGILGFVGLFAPLAARHAAEKRRREELGRQEKETKFRL